MDGKVLLEDNAEAKELNGKCIVTTCSGSIKFHVTNIRSDIEFVFFTGGFLSPCLFGRSTPLGFSNPNKPLYGHLSSIDSTATSVSTIYSATTFQILSQIHGFE
ncbi:purple acid phosphatase, putative [Medicago truncatula]|uniref:Purple acid phosphatase, putative n=1 Tax=Medicago truncatula TaxID=3880 RepID=G7J0Q2_MEDTR|nr:purple acid phosphatase, putative [Medicago truncatula]